jgi:hypothetical protein
MNHDRIADAAAGLTASTWVTTTLTPLNEIAQFVLTLVGIVSGLAAAWYYVRNSRS